MFHALHQLHCPSLSSFAAPSSPFPHLQPGVWAEGQSTALSISDPAATALLSPSPGVWSLFLTLAVVTPTNPTQSQAESGREHPQWVLCLFPRAGSLARGAVAELLPLPSPPQQAGAVCHPPGTAADEFFMLPRPCLRRQPYGPLFSGWGVTQPPSLAARLCISGICSMSRFLTLS